MSDFSRAAGQRTIPVLWTGWMPNRREDRVVIDGSLVTSRGPGTALEFALQLVALLYDDQKASEVAEPMVVKG